MSKQDLTILARIYAFIYPILRLIIASSIQNQTQAGSKRKMIVHIYTNEHPGTFEDTILLDKNTSSWVPNSRKDLLGGANDGDFIGGPIFFLVLDYDTIDLMVYRLGGQPYFFNNRFWIQIIDFVNNYSLIYISHVTL